MGYMNKHHGDVLLAIAETFSSLGREKAKKNGWSGGSYNLKEAKLVSIDTQQLELDVIIDERGKKERTERVQVELGTRRRNP